MQIARKNAKSTLAAGQGLFAFFDGEPGAEVYSAATTRDQAKIIFDVAKSMVHGHSILKKHLTASTLNIHSEATNSKFEPLSADAHTLDGKNVYVALVDELHAHKDGRVWSVLETGTGSRQQPLMIAVTTAGFERSVCIQQYNYAEQVLDGIIFDDTFFPLIYEIDEGDDWQSPDVWRKANPNLDVSIFAKQLETTCKQAVAIPERQNEFLCKHLNKWVNQADKWINLDDWQKCTGNYTEDELKGRMCFGGMDLSATNDITAFVLVFPPENDKTWRVVTRFWVPEEQVKKRSKGYLVDKVPYDAWLRDGHIKCTPGNVVDYDFIRAEILALADLYDIKSINYDRYRATETSIKREAEGLTLLGTAQGAITFTEPMQRFQGVLADRFFAHNNNPALTWMANNMVVRYDANMNMAPDKKSAKDRIDGIVALLMGFAGAIHYLDNQTSVYEQDMWV